MQKFRLTCNPMYLKVNVYCLSCVSQVRQRYSGTFPSWLRDWWTGTGVDDLDLNPMATDNLGELLGFFGLLYCWRALASPSYKAAWIIHDRVLIVRINRCNQKDEWALLEEKVKMALSSLFQLHSWLHLMEYRALHVKCACYVHQWYK